MSGFESPRHSATDAASPRLVQLINLAIEGELDGAEKAELEQILAADAAARSRGGRIAYALESGRPAVIVTNLYLRARSARAAGIVNPLDIQMDLIAYRKEGAS